jgi:adenylate kinase
MEKGALVPDGLVIQMILKRMEARDTSAGVILDGFPRTVAQAKALDQALANQGKRIDWALYINVPSEELVARISGRWICRQCQTPYHTVNSPPKIAGKCDKCGGKLYQRSDDTEATVRERLKVYFNQTAPVLEYYRKKRNLLEVDGRRNIETVTADVLQILERVKGSTSDNCKIS